jgi:hypothetical protein
MADVNATFCNNYSESRLYVIYDIKRDPNAPLEIFRGYLEPNQCTNTLSLYTGDDLWGEALYMRSDGAQNVVDNITDGTTVSME